MVQIVYKHTIVPGSETAFTEAWERCRAKMLERADGALESTLFRDAQSPTTFFTVTRWRSIEDWKAYWGKGIPDPEGEISSNAVLVEVKTVTRTGSRAEC